jgi:hypothetical protein
MVWANADAELDLTLILWGKSWFARQNVMDLAPLVLVRFRVNAQNALIRVESLRLVLQKAPVNVCLALTTQTSLV